MLAKVREEVRAEVARMPVPPPAPPVREVPHHLDEARLRHMQAQVEQAQHQYTELLKHTLYPSLTSFRPQYMNDGSVSSRVSYQYNGGYCFYPGPIGSITGCPSGY